MNNTIVIANHTVFDPRQIFALNYSYLLNVSGLSHKQFVFFTVAIFLFLSLFYLLQKLGLTQRVKFKEEHFEESTIVYRSYEGPNHQISAAFGKVIQETNNVFKFSQSFAMYYQEPDDTEKKEHQVSRAIFGIMPSENQLAKVSFFISKFPNYKQAKLPRTKVIGTKYPYFNSMSFVAIVTRVYSKLSQHVKKYQLTVGPCIIEVYHMLGKDQHIKIMTPMENFDHFKLWHPTQEEEENMEKPKTQ